MALPYNWGMRIRRVAVQIALVLTPLAYGTVHPLPVAIFQTAGFCLCAWVCIEQARKLTVPRYTDPLLGIGLTAIALGLLQLVPIPASLLTWVSPGTQRFALDLLASTQIEPPRYRSIALSAAEVQAGILWVATLVAWYVVLDAETRTRTDARAVVRTLAMSGAGLAVLGIAQRLSHAKAIYWLGLERKQFFATFINPNNAAGLLTLATSACLAAAATSRHKHRWHAAAALTSAGVLLSLSRGGIGVLTMALLLIALWHWRTRSLKPAPALRLWSRALVPTGFVFGVIALVGWVGATDVIGELESLKEDQGLNGRIPLWLDALRRMWPAFPLFGVGYGNFAQAYPAFQSPPTRWEIAAIENEYLHALLEGGILGFALALFATILVLRRAIGQYRGPSRLRAPLAAGVVALLTHLCVDFPLHLGAPGLWLLAAVAIISRQERDSDRRQGL